ncbi:CG31016, partial [Drosophila busckii]
KSLEFEFEYGKFCRSSYKMKLKRLSCFYKSKSAPFLQLAPFKVEQLSLDPYIVVYHDVIYESEILQLQSMTKSQLMGTTVKIETGNLQSSQHRTSRGAWLPHDDSSDADLELIDRIQLRTEHMTELLLESNMNLNMQFLHYGFGGHYTLHHDFLNLTLKSLVFDDRYATLLFYVNDVEKGGVTAFPYLNIAVKPRRGKALIWNSLDPFSFDYDHRTFHAACPVLVGHKLALTQWIHERDQMFTLPCYYAPKERKYNYSLSYLD